MTSFDVLVIGGGPAGATAALALARAGLTVAVVEKAAFPRRKVCGEFISATTWPLLRRLGVARKLLALAGPPVRRVGFYSGDTVVHAPMPSPDDSDAWGQAVGREFLDHELLDAAARMGASVYQPYSVESCDDEGGRWRAVISGRGGERLALQARAIVAAHGSWERGALPTQSGRIDPAPGDLVGFKAHFHSTRLAAGTMPLVLFPGGYGGVVASDRGRTSFSCCIRRDALRACRALRPGASAAESVLAHATEACRGLREALDGAVREGPWLSAGPIRPGIRALARSRVFVAGNAAGEAHPMVAEGLSMAMQSGWLAAERIVAAGGLGDAALDEAAAGYTRAWKRQFAARVRASAAFAAIMMAPPTRAAATSLLARAPAVLTWGARRSGKAAVLRSIEALP